MPEPVRIAFDDQDRDVIHAEADRRNASHPLGTLTYRNRGTGELGHDTGTDQLYGCAGEWALALHLDLEPDFGRDGPPPPGAADFPGRIDVKTARQHRHRLIVPLDDATDKRYVFVTIEQGEVLIRGWIDAADARRPAYYDDPVGGRPAYFVPAAALNPIGTLDAMVPAPMADKGRHQ